MQEWFNEADQEDLRSLNIFNTIHYLNKNNDYNNLIQNSKKYIDGGFDPQKAVDAAEDFWYDNYM